jgi:hypothetical protein
LDAGAGAEWTIDGEQNHQIGYFDTCAFSVQLFYSQKIGGQDIIDLITTSIERFAWNGRVGALGYLYCQRLLQEEGGVDGQVSDQLVRPDWDGMKMVPLRPTIGIGRDFDGVCGIPSALVECQLGMIQVYYLHGIPEYTYGSRLHRVAVAEVSVRVRSRIHAFFRLLAATIKPKLLDLQQKEGKSAWFTGFRCG